MAKVLRQGGCVSTPLPLDWTCRPTPAGTYEHELSLAPDDWLECQALTPGTEIRLDGHLVATAETLSQTIEIPSPRSGASHLSIHLSPRPHRTARRPRWRSRLGIDETLRTHRTPLIGHLPGAAPISLRSITHHRPHPGAPVVRTVDIGTRLAPDGTGHLTLRLTGTNLAGNRAQLRLAGHTSELAAESGALHAELTIPDAPLWWPHTHGTPTTLPITADIGGTPIDLGHVGFATIARRDPAQGFGLVVNGTPIFCRGAIWPGSDQLAEPQAALRAARDAGMNMLRIPGTAAYETPEFFAACDALGLLVWHDFMFARFDYPDDPAFLDAARAEARSFLHRVRAHPCLAVLCGGTEIAQSAAMAGCRPDTWHMPLFETVLAEQAAALRPDRPYVPHSPLAGPEDPFPFAASAAIAHYFGVGGYLRPLHDLETAGVRFAAECLAFANPPDPASCRRIRLASPAWHAGIPRDAEASWDFQDVRDHYVERLFGPAAAATRREDPLAWLDLGRAAIALVLQDAIGTWRTDAICAGALVLALHDVIPGSGWGVIGHDGRPKSAWHALRAVCQPIQILLRDRGQNGIVLYAINETATPRRVDIGLRGLTRDGAVEPLGATTLELAPRETRAIPATALMGRWRDIGHAWRFGPPNFTVLGATLDDAGSGAQSGERLSEATLFPSGPALDRTRIGLSAHLQGEAETWTVRLSTDSFAQFVQFDDDEFVPDHDHIHLWPGETRTIALRRAGSRFVCPSGTVTALNASAPSHYGLAA